MLMEAGVCVLVSGQYKPKLSDVCVGRFPGHAERLLWGQSGNLRHKTTSREA